MLWKMVFLVTVNVVTRDSVACCESWLFCCELWLLCLAFNVL